MTWIPWYVWVIVLLFIPLDTLGGVWRRGLRWRYAPLIFIGQLGALARILAVLWFAGLVWDALPAEMRLGLLAFGAYARPTTEILIVIMVAGGYVGVKEWCGQQLAEYQCWACQRVVTPPDNPPLAILAKFTEWPWAPCLVGHIPTYVGEVVHPACERLADERRKAWIEARAGLDVIAV